MSEIITVGLDLAKNVFQVHGTDGAGRAVLRKKIRRGQVLEFFSQLPSCVVAMEACGGAHFWGREIGKLGHEVRLIPPAYVKPFVKRQKNDMADAEAICEAAMRPTMRFVPVKSEETQGAAMVFRVRELLIRQRTQAINALRGHLTEFGQIVPQGAANASKLVALVEDPESVLPADAIPTLKVLVAALMHLEAEIAKLSEFMSDPTLFQTAPGKFEKASLALSERQAALADAEDRDGLLAKADEILGENVAVHDTRLVVNYWRLSDDRRLVFGGGENLGYRFPRDIAAKVRKPLEQVYPQLKGVRITHAWGGTLAITLNRMPHFARPAPNCLSASGYSGHGLALSNLAGKLMAQAVMGQSEGFDAMAALPSRPFPGGAGLRWPLLVAGMSWYSLRDRVGV